MRENITAHDSETGRSLVLYSIKTLDELPRIIESPSRHFVAMLILDAAKTDDAAITKLA